jgi:hypothetical protein
MPDGFIFIPKIIPILVYLGAPWNGKCCIFYDHFEYLTSIRYIVHMALCYSLWSIGIFFPVLVCLDKEKSGNPELVNCPFRSVLTEGTKFRHWREYLKQTCP